MSIKPEATTSNKKYDELLIIEEKNNKYIEKCSKKIEELEKKVATLERECQGLRLMANFLYEMERAIVNKDSDLRLFSFHQFYSPSPNRYDELMMFIHEVRKFCEDSSYRNSRISIFNVF